MNIKSRKTAQGLTEYVILIVLVAITVLGAVRAFGNRLWLKTIEATIAIGLMGDESKPKAD